MVGSPRRIEVGKLRGTWFVQLNDLGERMTIGPTWVLIVWNGQDFVLRLAALVSPHEVGHELPEPGACSRAATCSPEPQHAHPIRPISSTNRIWMNPFGVVPPSLQAPRLVRALWPNWDAHRRHDANGATGSAPLAATRPLRALKYDGARGHNSAGKGDVSVSGKC